MTRLAAVILLLAACTAQPSQTQLRDTLQDFMLTPAERCQEARDILAGIPDPTVEEAALGAAACAQERLQ